MVLGMLKMRAKGNLHVDAKRELINALEMAIANANPIYKSCLNCVNFREQRGEVCQLVNQRPPARVIAYGCKMWEPNDEIPF
jgi:recombinational DNA repair protein RecR